MFTLPEPLHSAVVHFPIVLILLGAAVAVAAVFIRKWWNLPRLAAVLLTLGSVGAVASVWAGDREEEIVGNISTQAEQILDEHEDWGGRTRTLAIVAAVLAIASAAFGGFPRTARGIGIATALVAMGAAYAVAVTGHLGGQLVFRHGIGINMAADSPVAIQGSMAKASQEAAENEE